LAKSEGFKAKAAFLVLTRSIIGAGGASSRGVLDWLVPCVVEFLTSEDWAVRKMKSIKGITVISKSDEADFSNKFKCKTTKLNSEQSLNSGNTSHIRVVKHHLNIYNYCRFLI
jgi:hypothetical protein